MEKVREKNPKENANIISKITFLFTLGMFRKGIKKDLEEEDVYEVLSYLKSKPLGDKLEKEWEKQKKINGKVSVLAVIIKRFGLTYVCFGFMQLFFKTMLILISPMSMGKLVSYFTPGQTKLTKADAIYYACLTVGMNGIYFIYAHSYMLLITELTMKVRISICSFLYRRALKLNSTSFNQTATGKIVTLITKDVLLFDSAILFANDLWIGVIQTIIIGYIIYLQIGVSAILGLGFFIFIVIIQAFVGKRSANYRYKTAHKTDERLRITQEALSAIKIIKMYAWEDFFAKTVNAIRKSEIRTIKKIFYLKAISFTLGTISSKISFYICVVTYVYFGHNITAEKAFVVLGCYHTLRSTLTIFIPIGIVQLAELKSALIRIGDMLKIIENTPERPDIDEDQIVVPKVSIDKTSVRIQDKKILEGVNLEINSGLNIITGHVGSGKTTLLKLILQDVPVSEGTVKCKGSKSYASQEPWLFPSTIKHNILFGQPYNSTRYEKVLEVVSLKHDLEQFPDGDETIVIDSGLNLSKGQQARINLARAIYKQADIYLLDDCLSSLDAHVSKSVFNDCIKGFLKDKICVLVTHNVLHLQEADNILVLKDGMVEHSGSYQELLDKKVDLNVIKINKEQGKNSRPISKVINEDENSNEKSGLLREKVIPSSVYAEKKHEGKVEFDIYKQYFKFGGGLKMIILIFTIFAITQGTLSYSDILVSEWVDLEQNITNFKVTNKTNTTDYQDVLQKHSWTLNLYTILMAGSTVFVLCRGFTYFQFSCYASINLHKKIFAKIMHATMEFFDTHLIGNILNRFSKDISTIDEYIPYIIFECFRIVCILLGILYVVCSVNLYFLFPSMVIAAILCVVRYYYLPTSRSLKRLDGATRSPVVGHLNASLEGLSTIRASQAQNFVKDEFDRHQDLNTSASYMYSVASRAFGFFMDMLCIIYITVIVVVFLTIKHNIFAGRVGLALTQAFSLTGLLQWGVRQWAELENQMTCVERALEYSKSNPESLLGEKPPKWGEKGKIQYQDVFLKYGEVTVLKNINFTIEPKEKIGIVGRTGAGKSSIISTLFRLYDIEGSIYIDDVNIKAVAVKTLRKKISIIPQDPILFSGTIRENLDPNNEFSDEKIWAALTEVRLNDVITTLDSDISQGGSNFSTGQKQLMCLARAIIKNNKIIVMDEATANVDPNTDNLIQSTIREKFVDCTVLSIAHRLQSVMNLDKIMVIDDGRVVEFDKPQVLLEKRNLFYSMAKQAGLV